MSSLTLERPATHATVAAIDEDEHGGEENQYLTFNLAGEVFAVGILSVKEIIQYHRPTPVPMAPPWIAGVLNLRGAVVPVVDLQQRFGRAPSEPTKRTCVVIVEVAQGEESLVIGVLVDSVSEVLEILPDAIEPPPSFGARLRADFMRGLGKIGGRFVVVLDANRVLSIAEISALGHADSAAVAA